MKWNIEELFKMVAAGDIDFNKFAMIVNDKISSEYSVGYSEGWDAGYEQGHTTGFNSGYTDGVIDSK